MPDLYVVTTVLSVVAAMIALGVFLRRVVVVLPLRKVARMNQDGRLGEARAMRPPKGRARSAFLSSQAMAAMSQGDLPDAERLIREALEAPGASEASLDLARRLLGNVLTQSGKYAEAVALLSTSAHEPESALARARIAVERGEDEFAERVLTSLPDNPRLEPVRLRTLGALRVRQGAYADGDAVLAEAVEAFPSSMDADIAHALALRADAALGSGRRDEARAHVNSALDHLARRPQNSSAAVRVHSAAARVRIQEGNAEAALEHVAKARLAASGVQSPPLHARLNAAEAEVALAIGEVDTARALLEAAITIHDGLGEQPAADQLRRRLAELP